MLKVACVGFYGGVAREYNPGSFLIGWQMVRELQRRLGPDALLDLHSLDLGGEYDELWTETQDGLTIRFFCRHKAAALLDHIADHYDALVIGGDNVWFTRDPRSVFLAASDRLHASKVRLAFNCVSTVRPREELLPLRVPISRACTRASYTCVRSPHLHRVLVDDFALPNIMQCPDPVLGVDASALAGVALPILPAARKPRLGVAVSPIMVNVLIDCFRAMPELDAWDVCVYPFTRLYQQLESVLRIKAAFGDRFHYVERALSPLESYALIGAFDLSLNDTYHGTIAAVIQGKPFIAFSHREASRSRAVQLFQTLGIDGAPIPFTSSESRPEGWAATVMRAVYDMPIGAAVQPTADRHRSDVDSIGRRLREALARPTRVTEAALARARGEIDRHFSALARAIP